MTLIELYREKLIETIGTVYNDKINSEKVEEFVDNIIKKYNNNKKITCVGRNLYQYKNNQEYDANEIFNIIDENQLNILANGSLTINKDPATSKIIDKWLNDRDKTKAVSLNYREQGELNLHKKYKNIEISIKELINSIYGASTMKKSFVSNVDVGSAITMQARNFISEMLWSIEKILERNVIFTNFNEYILWMNQLFKIKENSFSDEELSYITYIPTVEDCLNLFKKIARSVPGIMKVMDKMGASIYIMFEDMSEIKRIIYYYAYNPYDLIAKNEKIRNMYKDFLLNGRDFKDPYKYADEDKEFMEIMRNLMKKFVFVEICTLDRVDKYNTKTRKTCIISDTDSAMPSLYHTVILTLNSLDLGYLHENEQIYIKIVMFYAAIVTDYLNTMCYKFAKTCNSQIEGRKFRLIMKNEFFFSTVLLYSNAKKNYLGYQLINEGKIVPENDRLAKTGRALIGSSLNTDVNEKIINLLEKEVLLSKNFDPYKIAQGQEEISEFIVHGIKSGNKEFGILAHLNPDVKDPEASANTRAGLIWNILFPMNKMSFGDGMYVFDTYLKRKEDIELIDPKYNDVKEKIYRTIYGKNEYNIDISRFGLSKFAVPEESDDDLGIPEWIIPFININEMVNKHMKPLTSLSKSLLISQSKYISNAGTNEMKKLKGSTLIQL